MLCNSKYGTWTWSLPKEVGVRSVVPCELLGSDGGRIIWTQQDSCDSTCAWIWLIGTCSIPPDSGCSSQIPVKGTPRLQCQWPHGEQAEPHMAWESPFPSSLLTKRTILVMLLWLTLLFCLPSIFSPRRAQCFSDIILFIHHSAFWRETCMPI